MYSLDSLAALEPAFSPIILTNCFFRTPIIDHQCNGLRQLVYKFFRIYAYSIFSAPQPDFTVYNYWRVMTKIQTFIYEYAFTTVKE